MESLERRGAWVIHCPTIRIATSPDSVHTHWAVEQHEGYDLIVFTSVNGVAVFWDQLVAIREVAKLPEGLRTAAIGPATAEALLERGVVADLVPDEYVAEAVAGALAQRYDLAGRRMLLPRAAGARKVLPERLRAAGAEVDELVVYESRPDPEGIAQLREANDRGEVDMVTFTAVSTIRHFVDLAGASLGGSRAAVIGPVTAAAAREVGLRVDVEACVYTVSGLVGAICDYYGGLERPA